MTKQCQTVSDGYYLTNGDRNVGFMSELKIVVVIKGCVYGGIFKIKNNFK